MRKKIAFFLSSFDVGGAERQYWYLIDSISRDLFDIHIIQIAHRSSRPLKHSHPSAALRTFEMRHKYDIGMLFRVAGYIRKNRIDLIQSQLFMDNQIARAVGLLSGCTVITSVRGGPILGKLRTAIEHGFQWLSKCVVVNSSWLKDVLVKDGVNPEKIHVIYNGIDPVKFQVTTDRMLLREKYGIEPHAKVVGIVARLHPMKDHRTFFDVIRIVKGRVPEICAVVAGDGALRAELEDYVDTIGIRKHVCFLGSIVQELPEVLRMMDVFLLTSRWGESLPNVLLEAMSAGVPVVASNIHGVPEVVEDGVNGFLAKMGESEHMADSVERLLLDDQLRDEFIENGLSTVSRFSIPVMVGKYENLYSKVLEE